MSEHGTKRCTRCRKEKPSDEFMALDAVAHAGQQICEDCIEPWDEVVDV